MRSSDALYSISLIVPCLNEEKNLQGAIDSIKKALSDTGSFPDYEVLIFDDCSTDSTGAVAEEIKRREKNIRVIHNKRNMGFGYNYTEGVRLAKKEFIIMIPGDDEIPPDAIKAVFSKAGFADIVIPYTVNPEVRPVARRVISRAFSLGMNALFGLNLKYYNGTCLIRAKLLKKTPMKTWGFAYMASILVRLIRAGASYTEAAVNIRPRDTGKTKAFRLKNIMSVLGAIAGLFWEVRVRERGRYNIRPRRHKPELQGRA